MTQSAHAVAEKAIIVNKEEEILLLKRSVSSSHQPGCWDIPGGRIDPREGPQEALTRECVEEAGLVVEVGKPIGVNHFVRDDGQMIVMIIFGCVVLGGEVVISDEHEQYQWVSHSRAKELLPNMGYAIENM